MSRLLQETIRRKKENGQKLLSVFVTAGYPNLADTLPIIMDLEKNSVDFIELGVPFSDPIADGPVIQEASDRAIANGMHLTRILDLVSRLRQNSRLPVILMGYLNPFYSMGLDHFLEKAARAGVDGLIIPDWPLEESDHYSEKLKALDLDLIHLVAPNTNAQRVEAIRRRSTAFMYAVAYSGVTGGDPERAANNIEFIKDLSTDGKTAVMVGFGIKSREDYLRYTAIADGVIIGSAFLHLLANSRKTQRSADISKFITSIRDQ